MSISAIVLTKNEAKTIEKCLKSLSWCDEVIVIDDNSTDKTEEIAKGFKATIYKRDLNEDFSAQRNFGLEKESSEWAIFVDADEEVSKELAEEIKLVTAKTSVDGYYIKRRDFAFGKWLNFGETANLYLLRLGRKGNGKWERPVHETWKIKGTAGKLQNCLLHYSHEELTPSLEKINDYTNIEAGYRIKKGDSSNYFQILFFPLGKFIKNFFLLGGFLDGMSGFLMAGLMSVHSFLVRVKLWELQNRVSEKYSNK